MEFHHPATELITISGPTTNRVYNWLRRQPSGDLHIVPDSYIDPVSHQLTDYFEYNIHFPLRAKLKPYWFQPDSEPEIVQQEAPVVVETESIRPERWSESQSLEETAGSRTAGQYFERIRKYQL